MTLDGQIVEIDYVGPDGHRAWRRVLPVAFYFGTHDSFPELQWLLDCWDCDKGEDRTFALAGTRGWRRPE